MRNRVTLLLILTLTASSLIMVEHTSAQTNPAVPQFTLSIVDHSYDVAPTYTTDPYTGNTTTVSSGYHVEKRFIDVQIKNQNPVPYSPYTVANQGVDKVYYNIRAKGHFEAWTGNEPNSRSNLAPSDSEYTTVEFGFGQSNPGGFSIWLGYITPGGQVDFQVEAFTGYYQQITQNVSDGGCWRIATNSVFTQTGSSGWSPTQTITVDPPPTATPEPSPTPSPTPASSPSPSPSIPEFPTWIILPVVMIAALLAVILVRKKNVKSNTGTFSTF